LRKRRCFFGFLALFQLGSAAANSARPHARFFGGSKNVGQFLRYKVNSGDELGKILQVLGLTPLWGEGGFVAQTARLNQGVVNAKGDAIFSGQVLILPVEKLRASSHFSVDTATRFVTLDWHPEISDRSIASAESEPLPHLDSVQPITHVKRFFSLIPQLGFSGIKAKYSDQSSTLASQLNSGFRFEYGQSWSQKFTTKLELTYMKISFENPVPETLDNASSSLTHFELTANYQLFESLRYFVMIGFGQEFFIRATSSTNLNLDRVALPYTQAGVAYDIYKKEIFTLGAELSGKLIASGRTSSYDINLGLGYRTKLYLLDEMNKVFTLSTGFWWQSINQSTTILDQTKVEAGLEMGVVWRPGQ
jgi:hypothetical protein